VAKARELLLPEWETLVMDHHSATVALSKALDEVEKLKSELAARPATASRNDGVRKAMELAAKCMAVPTERST
jgi:hypothetical protein